MQIRALIDSLKRFEQSYPDMNVGICINVSKQGVLANNNFLLEERHGVLILIAPSHYEKAMMLWNEKERSEDE